VHVPRIAADPAAVLTAFVDAVAAGLIPPAPDPGRPVAGVVVQGEPDGPAVVLGGVHPVRLGVRAAARMRTILSGVAEARPEEIPMLHRLGLWGGAADASPESVFLSRRVASTRQHAGGDDALNAMNASRVHVTGDSPVAVALRGLLGDGQAGTRPPAAGSVTAGPSRPGVMVDLVVDTRLQSGTDDDSPVTAANARSTVVVRTSPSGVSVGPWIETGERPCFACVAASSGDPVAGEARSAARVRSAAALAALELANTTAGVGRTIRPGVVVDHDLDAGTSRMRAVPPRATCRRCSGPDLDHGSRVRTDAEAVAELMTSLLSVPPRRRWRAPAEHELHLTTAALRHQHRSATTTDPPVVRALLATQEQDGVVTRAHPSAGNLGAATVVERGPGLAVSVDIERLRPKYASGAVALGIADAGALLGGLVVQAGQSGQAVVMLDDTLHVESARVVGPVVRVVSDRGVADDVVRAGVPSSPGEVAERERSIRDPRWSNADAHVISRVAGLARTLLPVRAEIRVDLVSPERPRVEGSRPRDPVTPVSGSVAVAFGSARDCVAQTDVGREAALLVATVDLRSTTMLDRCRHDAAALLGMIAALAAEDGLRGCLVHGLVPDAVADTLGGGLLSSFPLFGWLCGREGGRTE